MPASPGDVAEDVGVAGLGAGHVLHQVLPLHLLNTQSDRPVVPLRVLEQIFLPVEIFVRKLSISILEVTQNIIVYLTLVSYLVLIEKDLNNSLLVQVHHPAG